MAGVRGGPAAGARAGADPRTDGEAHDDAGHPAAADGRHRRPRAQVGPTPCHPEELRALLDRMVALASERGGFTAWEYFFAFGGGTPPWISGLAQGTAIQALTRGSQLLADPKYLAVARRGLGAFAAHAADRRPRAVDVRDRAALPHLLVRRAGCACSTASCSRWSA